MADIPHATNFQDIEKQPKPGASLKLDMVCPRCQGYGKWNRELNAYGKGKHFQCGCDQCNGWGWVGEKDSKCLHEWKIGTTGRMFESLYTCTKCGVERIYDSSG
jgi:hypothetical protein